MQTKQIKTKQIKKHLNYLTKGTRSFVFLTKIKNKTAVIKKPRKNSEARIIHEAETLKLLNKYKIGPKLIRTKCKGQLCMEFIKGITIKEFLETEKDIKKIKYIVKQILNQCRTMDKLKLSKKEMTNPYKHIIIIKNNKPVMIDFERARFTEKPSNITQFFQYLSSKGIINFNEKIKTMLRNYKKSQSEKDFNRLMKIIKSKG